MQRQRNVAQRKEQIKAPKTELSNEEIANLLDTEMVELSHKIEGKMKATQSEIKKYI